MTTGVRNQNEQQVWNNHAMIAGGTLLASGTLMTIAHLINDAVSDGNRINPLYLKCMIGGIVCLSSKCVEHYIYDPRASLHPVALLLGKINGLVTALTLAPFTGSYCACAAGVCAAGLTAGELALHFMRIKRNA